MKKLDLESMKKILNLKPEDEEKIENVGIEFKEEEREGTFVMVDNDDTEISLDKDGLILLPLKKAKEKYPWIKEYLWKLVDKTKDEYTQDVSSADANGYFIWAQKGYKADFPLQACFYIKSTRLKQTVHNLIIVDEGAELHIINGCASANYVKEGAHISITEMFVKKNGLLSYTMIHDWGENVLVRPRSSIEVNENATFISNYVSMKKVKSTQSAPVVYLNGENAKTQLYSILYAPEGTHLDIGGKVYMRKKNTSAEIISRSVSAGGEIISPIELVGEADDIKGHMECSGILLNENGVIDAIPRLNGRARNIDLSHEAAVGKIAKEEIEYIQARGFTEDEAISLIIKGFLDLKIKSLPEYLQKSIDDTIDLSLKGI